LIERAVEAFRPQLDAKRIRVEFNFDHEPLFQGDPDKLSQVVGALLQNAVQYTSRGGDLRIWTEPSEGELRVVFSNSGGELSEKDLPFIFERFYRGEKSRSREHGGAGIGLAIVKELIDAHNGKVGADISDNLTAIWFSLPT
jgi:two-component system sensor histidine kinase BaeS